MANYKHRIVQGLADLIESYAGKGGDPMMKAVWWGLKGQVPSILQALDSNEEAIAQIEGKMREALGIEPEVRIEVTDGTPDIVLPEEQPPKPKRKKRKRKKRKDAKGNIS